MKMENSGGGPDSGSAGGQVPHQPVLYQQVMNALAPEKGSLFLDGTLGAGGHAKGVLQASTPHGQLLGLDRDAEALKIARQRLRAYKDRLILRQASYRNAPDILDQVGWKRVNGILLDLGVSSMQIDQPQRGFSFMEDGPLDMRFDQDQEVTAADILNSLEEPELVSIIWEYGEERYSRQIARAIVDARPIQTTRDLARLVQSVVPGHGSQIHPATRTFQALRIATNEELEVLSTALPELLNRLAPAGRIAIISFHSLEDRIVKQYFKKESSDCLCPPKQPVCTCGHQASIKVLTKKPVRPDKHEIEHNPRARSARLRVAEKL